MSSIQSFNTAVFGHGHFPDLLYRANHLWLTPDRVIVAPDRVKDLIFSHTDRVVFKRDGSGSGRGVFAIDKDQFDHASVESLGDGVVQTYIKQHPALRRLSPEAVATIRITTVVDHHGRMSLRGSYLRLGREGDAHVRSSSHIRVPVNQDTGMLEERGFTPAWQRIAEHPDTKASFVDQQIPSYASCRSLVLKLHAQVPMVPLIGWDMAIDEEGQVHLMEWNGIKTDIKILEATQGPWYADLGWESWWKDKERWLTSQSR
ncbi:MAG: hypothetical protein KTR24_06645 [Saprospiraceae bacterium]|nr:hypothetical protein [Saprospiraceae bacterium]